MKMTSKSAPNLFVLLAVILSISSTGGCIVVVPASTNTVTMTLIITSSSTATVTLTPKPSRMAMNTSADQELLDAKIRHPTITPIPPTATPSRTAYPSPTLPPACGTSQLGTPGTQTKENNHPILVEGTAILCNHGSLFEDYPTVLPLREAMLDLDSGVSTVDAADIGFDVSGTMRFYGIVNINNARAIFWSLNGLTKELPPQPTFEQCKEQVSLFSNDNVPLYVCVITNQGHIARVKFENSDPVQQVSSVEISFITWDEQVANP